MSAATDSKVAYNLAGLERRTLVRERDERSREESRTRAKSRAKAKTRAKARPAISGFSVFSGVVVFVMLVALLFSYVDLSEASDLSRRKEVELKKLQEENQMLEINYNQRVGALKVHEYAVTRLGMTKVDKSQIRYVETPDADVFEIAGKEKKESTGIISGLANCFSRVVEFIN